ncbi:MAG: hypothetical protein IJ400_04140 [Clostridia bacterium]|nr:hypothetical protein [Clostridia bacterium]
MKKVKLNLLRICALIVIFAVGISICSCNSPDNSQMTESEAEAYTKMNTMLEESNLPEDSYKQIKEMVENWSIYVCSKRNNVDKLRYNYEFYNRIINLLDQYDDFYQLLDKYDHGGLSPLVDEILNKNTNKLAYVDAINELLSDHRISDICEMLNEILERLEKKDDYYSSNGIIADYNPELYDLVLMMKSKIKIITDDNRSDILNEIATELSDRAIQFVAQEMVINSIASNIKDIKVNGVSQRLYFELVELKSFANRNLPYRSDGYERIEHYENEFISIVNNSSGNEIISNLVAYLSKMETEGYDNYSKRTSFIPKIQECEACEYEVCELLNELIDAVLSDDVEEVDDSFYRLKRALTDIDIDENKDGKWNSDDNLYVLECMVTEFDSIVEREEIAGNEYINRIDQLFENMKYELERADEEDCVELIDRESAYFEEQVELKIVGLEVASKSWLMRYHVATTEYLAMTDFKVEMDRLISEGKETTAKELTTQLEEINERYKTRIEEKFNNGGSRSEIIDILNEYEKELFTVSAKYKSDYVYAFMEGDLHEIAEALDYGNVSRVATELEELFFLATNQKIEIDPEEPPTDDESENSEEESKEQQGSGEYEEDNEQNQEQESESSDETIGHNGDSESPDEGFEENPDGVYYDYEYLERVLETLEYMCYGTSTKSEIRERIGKLLTIVSNISTAEIEEFKEAYIDVADIILEEAVHSYDNCTLLYGLLNEIYECRQALERDEITIVDKYLSYKNSVEVTEPDDFDEEQEKPEGNDQESEQVPPEDEQQGKSEKEESSDEDIYEEY